MHWKKHSMQKTGIYFILPSLTIILSLILFPVGYSVWVGFFTKHAFYPIEKFVGFKNYVYLFTKDPHFWFSLRNTLFYVAASISAQFALGMAAALLLNQSFKGRSLLRGMILFPYVMPTVIGVFLWRWIFHDAYGILNYILLYFGIIGKPIIWLGKSHIMLSLIIVSTWQFFPFVVICFLSRLQTIDPRLYDAAKMDGASRMQSFAHITLPEMRNIILVVLILRGIWMFTKFDVVWLMSGVSGIGRYVETLPIYAYRLSFEAGQIGMGSALSVISFVALIITAGILFIKLYEKEVAV